MGHYARLHAFPFFEKSWKLLNVMHLSNIQWKDLNNTLLKQHFWQNCYTKLQLLGFIVVYITNRLARRIIFRVNNHISTP
jgi:hypothetical protein